MAIIIHMTPSQGKIDRSEYNYFQSESGEYILRLDGVEVLRGSEGRLWDYIHRTHCYSVAHALTHEGYTILPIEVVS